MVVGSGEDENGSGEIPTTESYDRLPTITSGSSHVLFINPTVNNMRLFIRVTYDAGSPPGFLVWRHNGSVISSRTNPRVSILSGGGLTVRNAKFSDSGMYNVTVSNRLGQSIENFRVLFRCKLIILYYIVVILLAWLMKIGASLSP